MTKIHHVHLNRDQTGGKIRLFLSGFSRQKILTEKEIIEAVDLVPDFHLQGLKGFVYDPNRTQLYFKDFQLWPKLFNAKACYDHDDGFVIIFRFDDKKMFRHILYHEIGHYVYQSILDSQQKRRWVTQLYPRSQYISNYAKTSALEDFAESYANFILEPAKLRVINQKFYFLQSQVFKGKHYLT